MPVFNSVFKNELSEYLMLRQRAMTRQSHYQTQNTLSDFDRHLTQLGQTEKTVTEEILNSWIKKFSKINAKKTISDKVSCLRGFLKYLNYCGYPVFFPDCPKYSDNYVPYIFSDEEVAKIFYTADKIASINGKQKSYIRFTFPMLLRLLYCRGLRIGETLLLRVRDIDFNDGTLLMKHTKYDKQRIVPMHQTLTETLQRYCFSMRLMTKPDDYLFPADKNGKHLTWRSASAMFKKVLITAGIYIPPKAPRNRNQCLHCFRHLFTIKSFAQVERRGRSSDNSVPFLSVYLGHFDMGGTEKYLKFSGDMFPLYTEMFEAFAAGVFPEAPREE